jgi:hypothetical protein
MGLYGISLVGSGAGFLIFTNLFVVHDYYAYASGLFLVAAVAWGVVSLLEEESRWRRVTGVLLLGTCTGLAMTTYYQRLYPVQRANGPWAPELVSAVARVTPPDKVVVGFGLDWSSELPYYAGRRGLMWPSWMNHDPSDPEFRQAIEGIGFHRIGSMVLCLVRPGIDTPGRDRAFKLGRGAERWLSAAAQALHVEAAPVYVDPYCALYAGAGTQGVAARGARAPEEER